MRLPADAPRIAPWTSSQIPLVWFTPVMGLCGLAMAWRKGEQILGVAVGWSTLPFACALAAFAFAAANLGLAVRRHPAILLRDWRDPARINAFATVTLAPILVASFLAEPAPALAEPIWLFGVLLHLGLTFVSLRRWIDARDLAVTSLGPIWFMPIVGNLLVPVAGVELGHLDLSWFCFSVGIAFWPLLLGLVLHRLFFHAPLEDELHPTLFILISPPAVGFVAYLTLAGAVDRIALVLFDLTLFALLFLATLLPRLVRRRFSMLWWSFSFPTTAATVAIVDRAQALGGTMAFACGAAMILVSTVVVAGLGLWTLRVLAVETFAAISAGAGPSRAG